MKMIRLNICLFYKARYKERYKARYNERYKERYKKLKLFDKLYYLLIQII